MPIVPNFLERALMFTLNQAPAPLLEAWSAVAFRIVTAAVRLGVFDALDGNATTAAELAQRIGADGHATAMLLNALAAFGYLSKRGDRFANTKIAEKWLLSRSPTNFGPGLEYWDTILVKLFDNLESSIRDGTSSLSLYEWIEGEPETSRAFQEYMIAIAHTAGGEIASKLKGLDGASRVLDVGGGHATYSILLCQRHPNLSATVFDSPQALATGRANIEAAGLAQRIATQEGNLLDDELGNGYDVALLFNIIHGFSPEANVDLFRKVGRALKPGGRIVVLEQLDVNLRTPLMDAAQQVLALSYFHLLNGKIYAYDEIAAWLHEAGFGDVRRTGLLLSAGSALIEGIL